LEKLTGRTWEMAELNRQVAGMYARVYGYDEVDMKYGK
jgi:hypothetical protein